MQDQTSTNSASRFTGQENFAASPQQMFHALTNLDADGPLAKSIPHLVSAERDDRTLKCQVRSGFSFLRATLKITIQLDHVDHDARSAILAITSTGIGASMKIHCNITVNPADDQNTSSQVIWEAVVVERRGLLAAVSPALIRGAADSVIRDGWSAMRQNVEQ